MNHLLLALAMFCAETPSQEPPIADPIVFPVGFGRSKDEYRSVTLSVQKGVYYIVESKVECLTLCSPDRAVTFTNLRTKYPTGPIILGGRFAQNPDEEQEKEFSAPFIYKVEPGPAPVATAEIILVTKGDKPEVERRTISLKAPQPPPKPTPDVPDDKPTSNPLPSNKLRVLMTYDTADTLKPKENSILRSTKVYDATDKVNGEWRVWSAKEDASQESQWYRDAHARAKEKKQPWVIISSPKGFYEGFPASVDDLIAQINKLGG